MQKRLIEAKSQLQYGEWGKWLEEKVDFSQMTANRFMKVAEQYPNSPTLTNFPQTKIFALLDVPQEKREEFISQSHTINGVEKTVDDMTTRELQKVVAGNKRI